MLTSDEELLKKVELPPPDGGRPRSRRKFDFPFFLFLLFFAISAWSFGGYINTNWVVQNQADRTSALSARITDLYKKIDDLNKLIEVQRTRDKETSDLLDKINLQLAEIKGAASVVTSRTKAPPK